MYFKEKGVGGGQTSSRRPYDRLLISKIRVNLLNKRIGVSAVYCARFLYRLTARSRATETVHAYLKEKLCCACVIIKDITDYRFLCHYHFVLLSEIKDDFDMI